MRAISVVSMMTLISCLLNSVVTAAGTGSVVIVTDQEPVESYFSVDVPGSQALPFFYPTGVTGGIGVSFNAIPGLYRVSMGIFDYDNDVPYMLRVQLGKDIYVNQGVAPRNVGVGEEYYFNLTGVNTQAASIPPGFVHVNPTTQISQPYAGTIIASPLSSNTIPNQPLSNNAEMWNAINSELLQPISQQTGVVGNATVVVVPINGIPTAVYNPQFLTQGQPNLTLANISAPSAQSAWSGNALLQNTVSAYSGNAGLPVSAAQSDLTRLQEEKVILQQAQQREAQILQNILDEERRCINNPQQTPVGNMLRVQLLKEQEASALVRQQLLREQQLVAQQNMQLQMEISRQQEMLRNTQERQRREVQQIAERYKNECISQDYARKECDKRELIQLEMNLNRREQGELVMLAREQMNREQQELGRLSNEHKVVERVLMEQQQAEWYKNENQRREELQAAQREGRNITEVATQHDVQRQNERAAYEAQLHSLRQSQTQEYEQLISSIAEQQRVEKEQTIQRQLENHHTVQQRIEQLQGERWKLQLQELEQRYRNTLRSTLEYQQQQEKNMVAQGDRDYNELKQEQRNQRQTERAKTQRLQDVVTKIHEHTLALVEQERERVEAAARATIAAIREAQEAGDEAKEQELRQAARSDELLNRVIEDFTEEKLGALAGSGVRLANTVVAAQDVYELKRRAEMYHTNQHPEYAADYAMYEQLRRQYGREPDATMCLNVMAAGAEVLDQAYQEILPGLGRVVDIVDKVDEIINSVNQGSDLLASGATALNNGDIIEGATLLYQGGERIYQGTATGRETVSSISEDIGNLIADPLNAYSLE